MMEALCPYRRRPSIKAAAIRDFMRTIVAIGKRYGVVTEEAFREAVKYLIEDLLKTYVVRSWIYYGSNDIIYGRPSVIEVDVLVRDQKHILVEYKVHADKSNVAEPPRIGILYSKVTNTKPRLLLVVAMIDKGLLNYLKSLRSELGQGR